MSALGDTKLARRLQKRGVFANYTQCLKRVREWLSENDVADFDARQAIDRGDLDPRTATDPRSSSGRTAGSEPANVGSIPALGTTDTQQLREHLHRLSEAGSVIAVPPDAEVRLLAPSTKGRP